jgi:hypothetical protein
VGELNVCWIRSFKVTVYVKTLPDIDDIARSNPNWLDERISEEMAAAFQGKSRNAMATERCRGRGPKYIKDGGAVWYTRRLLIEYNNSKCVVPK